MADAERQLARELGFDDDELDSSSQQQEQPAKTYPKTHQQPHDLAPTHDAQAYIDSQRAMRTRTLRNNATAVVGSLHPTAGYDQHLLRAGAHSRRREHQGGDRLLSRAVMEQAGKGSPWMQEVNSDEDGNEYSNSSPSSSSSATSQSESSSQQRISEARQRIAEQAHQLKQAHHSMHLNQQRVARLQTIQKQQLLLLKQEMTSLRARESKMKAVRNALEKAKVWYEEETEVKLPDELEEEIAGVRSTFDEEERLHEMTLVDMRKALLSQVKNDMRLDGDTTPSTTQTKDKEHPNDSALRALEKKAKLMAKAIQKQHAQNQELKQQLKTLQQQVDESPQKPLSAANTPATQVGSPATTPQVVYSPPDRSSAPAKPQSANKMQDDIRQELAGTIAHLKRKRTSSTPSSKSSHTPTRNSGRKKAVPRAGKSRMRVTGRANRGRLVKRTSRLRTAARTVANTPLQSLQSRLKQRPKLSKSVRSTINIATNTLYRR